MMPSNFKIMHACMHVIYLRLTLLVKQYKILIYINLLMFPYIL
jgi:hypothetical protein